MNIKYAKYLLCNTIDLKDYLERYYGLNFKTVGNSYQTTCPIHNEKSPSFSIPKNKNYFKCFGCEAKGNIINFVEQYNNYNQEEAVKKICSDLGIELHEKRESTRLTTYADITKNEAIKYVSNLIKEHKEAYDYLTLERKMPIDIIKQFKLGASLSNEENKHHRNRIVFPITDSSLDGDILGFAYGYINNSSDYEKKYVNTNTNDFFKKSELFYGLNESIDNIHNKKSVYIVEGYFDVLSMHASGINNTIGVMCASISDDHINILKRLNCEINIFLDNDDAGEKGTKRAIEKFILNGIDIKKINIIEIKGFKDADELCNHNKHNYNAIHDILENSKIDPILYMIEEDISKYNSVKIKMQSEILDKINPLIDVLPDNISAMYSNYIYKLLDK